MAQGDSFTIFEKYNTSNSGETRYLDVPEDVKVEYVMVMAGFDASLRVYLEQNGTSISENSEFVSEGVLFNARDSTSTYENINLFVNGNSRFELRSKDFENKNATCILLVSGIELK